MTDWNAISAFMGAVVPWPGEEVPPSGYVNLHYDFAPDPNKPASKKKVAAGGALPGFALSTTDAFLGRVSLLATKPERWRNQFFCVSMQKNNNGLNKTKKSYKALRNRANAVAVKALWIDCDVKPDDKTGKHYTSDTEAMKALMGFWTKHGLPNPSAIVASGGGFHVYWISQDQMTVDEWQPLANGLKTLLLADKIKCDTGVTGDVARVLRMPGTLNYKYDPPVVAKLLPGPLTPYDFKTPPFQNLLNFTPAFQPTAATPTHNIFADGITVASFGKPHPGFDQFKGEPDLNAGLEREEIKLDPLPIIQQCGFLKEALLTGGKDFSQPLWNLSVLCSTFMEDGNAIAHKISNQHPEYSETDTQALFDRKLVERTAQGIGYPSCATIESNGSTACSQCPLRSKGKSPLNVRPAVAATVSHQAPSAAVVSGVVDDPSYWMPDGFEMNDDGIVCKVYVDKDEDGNEMMVHAPLFKCVVGKFWVGLTGGVTEKLHYTASADKGSEVEASFSMAEMSKQDFVHTLGVARVLTNFPKASVKDIQEFHLSTLGKLRAAAAAQKAVPFGWYEENGVRRGFVFGGKIMTDDGNERPCGNTDPVISRNYAPVGTFAEWEEAAKLITDRKRPELTAMVLVSFLSPLLELVGRKTVMFSAFSGDSGGGKSTAYDVGLSVWGHPLQTKGTESQTVNNITTYMKTIRNLPFYWDEITDDGHREKVRKIMHEADGGKEKGRNLSGTTVQDGGTWALALHYASNGSYLSFLRANNQNTAAAVNRVLEWEVKRIEGGPGWMDDADATLTLNKTHRNYGIMGLRYAKYLAMNHKAIAAECVAEINKMQKILGGSQQDRIWLAGVGLMICAARYAKACGLDVDPDEIEKFMKVVYDDNRKARDEFMPGGSVDNSEAALTRYLKERDAGQRVVWTNYIHNKKGKPPKAVVVLRGPTDQKNYQGGVEVRFALDNKACCISRKDFAKWIAEEKYADTQIWAGLARMYNTFNQRLNLGSGWTSLGPGREDCIVLRVTPNSPLWDYMMGPVQPDQRAAVEAAAPIELETDDAA